MKRKQSVKNIHVGEGSGRKGMWKRELESRDRPANQINATLTSVRATLLTPRGPLCALRAHLGFLSGRAVTTSASS